MQIEDWRESLSNAVSESEVKALLRNKPPGASSISVALPMVKCDLDRLPGLRRLTNGE